MEWPIPFKTTKQQKTKMFLRKTGYKEEQNWKSRAQLQQSTLANSLHGLSSKIKMMYLGKTAAQRSGSEIGWTQLRFFRWSEDCLRIRSKWLLSDTEIGGDVMIATDFVNTKERDV